MTKRAIVRYGDRTTHGGTVVTADLTYVLYGKNVARVGDKVSCPQCGGTHPIVTGALDVLSGQPIARQDDETACGAKLIASQFTATIDDGAGGAAPAATAATAVPRLVANTDETDEPLALRFQALDPETGKPCPKCVYILKRETGVAHGGVTDSEGFTEVIETAHPEQIAVHFMFRSPKGKSINREELEV
jgi:uncharacterized Zn-binding protein involved in type VI secretion